MSEEPRRYSEREFALILREASRTRVEGSSASHSGMTLEEIRAVAAEVGIDPLAIERAAALLPANQDPGRLARWIGGPLRYRMEHTASGTLDDDTRERVIDAVRRAAEVHGTVGTRDQTLEWHSGVEPSQIHVTVRPTNVGAEIRVTSDRSGALMLTGFMSLMGGGIVAGITGAIIDPDTVAVGLAIFGGGLSGGLVVARSLWARTSRSVQTRIARIMSAVSDELSEAGSDGQPES